jgi:catechol 2,3-dioxygenase-like lactoylglutathione lyase family enzyme
LAFKGFRLAKIDQVCVVVRDIEKTVEQYSKILGVGPWSIYTMAPPELTNTTIRGKPEHFSMQMAFARVGSTMLELIQPLEGESIYKEFLEEKGEGLHHIASYEVDDLRRTLAWFKKKRILALQSGTWGGASFVYLDAEEKLGTIIELVKRVSEFPKPESTYPLLKRKRKQKARIALVH